MRDCGHSLLLVGPVCEERNWGYEIVQGNVGSRFTKDGETVFELASQGSMTVVLEEAVVASVGEKSCLDMHTATPEPVVCRASVQQLEDSECEGRSDSERQQQGCTLIGGAGCDCSRCEARFSGGDMKEESCGLCESQLETESKLRHALLVKPKPGSGAEKLASREVTEPDWMVKHQLDGHPYDSRCPWCVQGRLKQKQHFRQVPGSGTDSAGATVKVDLTGPYEPGVTGSTWALVGVHEERVTGAM